jgi:RNA recognition motif-containing protein
VDTHKIYVGGLAESVGSMDLGQYFSELAEVVDATVMMDRESGRSRGFGFVAFNESVDPDRITEILDSEHIVDGKSINVRLAFKRANNPTPRQNSRNNDFGGGGGGGYDEDFEKVQSKPRGSRSMFRTSMPIPGTPGWPGVTGVSSSFGGARALSTLPALNSTPRVNLMKKPPTMRINGPAIRTVMMKMLR